MSFRVLIAQGLLSWKGVAKGLFCTQWNNPVFLILIYFQSVYMVDYIYWFMCVENVWDEVYLIMGDGIFDISLNLVCNFFENICFDIHRKNWSVSFFLWWVFLLLGHQCNCGLIKWIGQCFFCFYFQNYFEKY